MHRRRTGELDFGGSNVRRGVSLGIVQVSNTKPTYGASLEVKETYSKNERGRPLRRPLELLSKAATVDDDAHTIFRRRFHQTGNMPSCTFPLYSTAVSVEAARPMHRS